ncbi:MAG: hypothetical protein A2689_02550 [Candidatus Levybacteria bacterium RIFCSPHIGHO2_01_FULL_38_96]|nr:MAG: hypothetical protein A2689_02550 [Candidatus Levybacteria bacterium RIFCSPHIGHO2_01_FULL_38_96]
MGELFSNSLIFHFWNIFSSPVNEKEARRDYEKFDFTFGNFLKFLGLNFKKEADLIWRTRG